MPAIAMVIQHGADTCEFAANLASDLGYEVLDYRPMELSLAASFRPGWHRFGAWLRAPSRRSQPTHPAAAALRGLHEQCLEALRSRHVLLVAWSAVLALPPNQAVIRVLLHAPRETRLAQLAERQAGRTDRDAEQRFDRMEQKMTAYLEFLHGRAWNAPHRFDLTIDATRCTPRTCSALLQSWLATTAFSAAATAQPVALGASAFSVKPGGCAARTFAVLDRERVDLTGVQSHEAAIAVIEQRLHHECRRRHD